jgi:replicative DNA helicase
VTLGSLEKYGTSFQIKVLSSLLTHKEFLLNIQDVLSEEYFSNQAHKWIIKQIMQYFQKYHTCPSMDVLKVELKKIDNEVLQVSIKEQLREAYKASDEDLKYVEEEFSNFCKNQQLKKALLTSVDFLNAGDYDSIRTMIDNALKAGQDKNIGHEYNKDTESRYREDHRRTVPTPWPPFNDLLMGGLGGGDFGLIFGNPGGGKSWSLVALGGYAVKLGYNVIHYTLELGADYVGRRYDAFFTNIPVNNIMNHKDKVDDVIPQLEGQLIIKEFPTGKATIGTVESHIKKCIDLDFNPDLIIIDYVDLLRSKRNSRERKDEIDDIYISTKGLARELNLPIWSVSQVNRAGAKDDIIEGDKAAGSYDKIMITDVAISLSRKRQDKVNGTGRFHIMKNRYGMDGLTFSVKADTSTGHFEVSTQVMDDDDEVISKQASSNNGFGGIDSVDKALIKQKFFELTN